MKELMISEYVDYNPGHNILVLFNNLAKSENDTWYLA